MSTHTPVLPQPVAILGYGNQGRAHAKNLRDSGVAVVVGAREGHGAAVAREDGFPVCSIAEAVRSSVLAVWLLPDQILPGALADCRSLYEDSKRVAAFAHSFVLKYRLFEFPPGARYFLVGPKGAGKILRENFEKGGGLPAVWAVSDQSDEALCAMARAYAEAIGCARNGFLETSFDLEAEGDLFGEQAVLCGGLLELIEQSFEVLVENGHDPKTAFFDVAYEAVLILRLWLDAGPAGLADRISPTALFGGLSRGPRVIPPEARAVLTQIFGEVRDGTFAREWLDEVKAGTPQLEATKKRIRASRLQKAWAEMKPELQ